MSENERSFKSWCLKINSDTYQKPELPTEYSKRNIPLKRIDGPQTSFKVLSMYFLLDAVRLLWNHRIDKPCASENSILCPLSVGQPRQRTIVSLHWIIFVKKTSENENEVSKVRV